MTCGEQRSFESSPGVWELVREISLAEPSVP
jgi:hypothetical protein